jgi:hypothetical protein
MYPKSGTEFNVVLMVLYVCTCVFNSGCKIEHLNLYFK